MTSEYIRIVARLTYKHTHTEFKMTYFLLKIILCSLTELKISNNNVQQTCSNHGHTMRAQVYIRETNRDCEMTNTGCLIFIIAIYFNDTIIIS